MALGYLRSPHVHGEGFTAEAAARRQPYGGAEAATGRACVLARARPRSSGITRSG